MKNTLQIIFTISIGFLLQFGANAQELTKTKVPFHKDIYVITKSIDSEINYFADEYPFFHTAELYRIDSETYELNIEQKKDGEVTVSTKTLSEKEYTDLKSEVSKRMLEKNVGVVYNKNGRFLKVQSLAYQGYLGGFTLSSMILENSENYGAALAMPYLGLGAGIVGGILGTANRDIPLAPTLGYASGASTGSYHGMLVGNLFVDDNDFDNFASTLLLSSTLFSVGESLLLQHIVKQNEWSAKRASALRLGNLSGAISGAGLSLLLGGENVNKYLFTGITLAGSAAGIMLYDSYFRNKDINVGNIQAIRLMNPFVTIGSTVIIGDLADTESTALLGATIMATNIGSVFLGELLFKNGHVTYDESLWYGLGLYGGSLIGIGVTTMVLYDNYTSNSGAIAAGIITPLGVGGMLLVHSLVSGDQEEERNLGFFEKNNLQINANPAALYVNKFIENPAYQQSAISINWTF